MGNNGWRKVSAVVEFSVNGDYTERDFSRDLETLLNTIPSGNDFPYRQLAGLRGRKSATRFKVAALSKSKAAMERSKSQRASEQHLRGLIAGLDQRINQLERFRNEG